MVIDKEIDWFISRPASGPNLPVNSKKRRLFKKRKLLHYISISFSKREISILAVFCQLKAAALSFPLDAYN